jgi:hypothetical protein
VALFQSVPADEIDAEFAADLPAEDDDVRVALEQRSRLAATEARVANGSRRPVEHHRAGDPRDLREATERVRPVALAHEHTLPLLRAFDGVLPGGLARGTTVAVRATQPDDLPTVPLDGRHARLDDPRRERGARVGDRGGRRHLGPPADGAPRSMGATSLALAMAAGPTGAGSWVALVGLPALGLAAAAELGLALERVAVIDAPPPDTWATVVGALTGAFDLIVFGAPARASSVPVKAADVRRLTARARERGTVLVQVDTAAASVDGVGADVRPKRAAWSAFEADLRLVVVASRWQGLGTGHGHLEGRQVTVEVTGRRSAARPRRTDLWFGAGEGLADAARLEQLDKLDALVGRAGAPAFAGADVDALLVGPGLAGPDPLADLASARRGRIRRVATEPVVRGRPDALLEGEGEGAGRSVWSDAG